MSDKISTNITQEITFNRFILSEELHTLSDNFSQKGHNPCLKENVINTEAGFNRKNIAMAVQTYLEEEYDCESRIILDMSLIVLLRFAKRACLQLFLDRFYQGVLTKNLFSNLLTRFSVCNGTLPKVEFNFSFDEKELLHYNRVHLAFQGKLQLFRQNVSLWQVKYE